MRFERVAVLDAYAEAGEVAVMLNDGRVLALSPLTTALWEALEDGPTGSEELARILLDRFGPPDGDIDATTLAIMTSLCDMGLVARVGPLEEGTFSVRNSPQSSPSI